MHQPSSSLSFCSPLNPPRRTLFYSSSPTVQFCGRAFRLATSIAGPHIELHMHVAHSEVTDAQAIPALLDFDADVYLIENAR